MKLDSTPITLTGTLTPNQEPKIADAPCHYKPTYETLHEASPEECEDNSTQKSQSPLFIFGSTFITIFFAEIGDKTQLSTLLISAESHSPWVVFVGSGAALITTSFLGVALGSLLAKHLSPKAINKAAGVSLLLISLMLFLDLIIA
ncbi:TMEM165/GDT1 family protein [Plectonema cf. radiosum LEGE 06105]|uniref:GDT1 family protein n=1 Tax=Plectonema cf. radiosum LEGE 06105 TaxID=945769 RepID=A0A8J7FCQ4_9CYAN|nr:TMEM165/GDT1 family protein [Plectonema radiosum]MBE9211856.1 TMEM165/GDT1 family protein [Plectonema cf. radiosum LEGE 06105]